MINTTLTQLKLYCDDLKVMDCKWMIYIMLSDWFDFTGNNISDETRMALGIW